MPAPLDRRRFLQTSAAGAALLAAPAVFAQGEQPSKTVTIGVMGMSRGRSLCLTFGSQPNVRLKYVCDVDAKRAAEGKAYVEQQTEQRPEAIGDFRKILDDPEVDALICAAPNHWHAPAGILACKAGKHAYIEKPCSHNAAEGELLVQAARTHKRAVQMGSQRRSGPTYIEAIQKLHEGALGRVYCARGFYNNLRESIGVGQPAAVPAELNYELWQGPAPRTPYVDNRIHYNWHWFWEWGNGELGNNGVHTLDICRWGLEVDYPVRVTSSGGRYRFEDDQQTPDTHSVLYEFEGRKMITWEGLSCSKHGGDFISFIGENGSMDVDAAGGYVIQDEKGKVVEQKKGTMSDKYHIENFLAAIRNDDPLNLNAEILKGHQSTLLCHLGNIAHRAGRVLNCNPADGHILEDSAAMALWQRDYEPGWEPVV